MKKYLTALLVLLLSLSFAGINKGWASNSKEWRRSIHIRKKTDIQHTNGRSKDACMVQAYIEKGVLTVSANWNAGVSTVDIHSYSSDESYSMTCSLMNGVPVVLPLPSDEEGTYTLTISTSDYVFTGVFEMAATDK